MLHGVPIAEDWILNFEKAANMLAEHKNVKLCKVDATVYTKLKKRYDVTSYPRILFFQKGVVTPVKYQFWKELLITSPAYMKRQVSTVKRVTANGS